MEHMEGVALACTRASVLTHGIGGTTVPLNLLDGIPWGVVSLSVRYSLRTTSLHVPVGTPTSVRETPQYM